MVLSQLPLFYLLFFSDLDVDLRGFSPLIVTYLYSLFLPILFPSSRLLTLRKYFSGQDGFPAIFIFS